MAQQLNDHDRARIMADYHVGMSQNAIAVKYEVSTATINKLCKGVVRKHVEKVNELVALKSEYLKKSEFAVNSALLNESTMEGNAIRREVEQRALDMQFIRSASMEISKKILEKVQTEDLTMFDLEKAQNAIGKGKENIYGKVPETAVQVNNNQHTYRWESDDE